MAKKILVKVPATEVRLVQFWYYQECDSMEEAEQLIKDLKTGDVIPYDLDYYPEEEVVDSWGLEEFPDEAEIVIEEEKETR